MERKKERNCFAWYVVVSWAHGVLMCRRFVPKRDSLPLVRRVYCCVRKNTEKRKKDANCEETAGENELMIFQFCKSCTSKSCF